MGPAVKPGQDLSASQQRLTDLRKSINNDHPKYPRVSDA